MADAFPARNLTPEVQALDFSFTANGTGAIDQSTIKGRGVKSVARTSLGLYTVTLEEAWDHIVAHSEGLQMAAAGDRKIQLGATDLKVAKTVQVRCVAVGSVADVAANDIVSVTLKLAKDV